MIDKDKLVELDDPELVRASGKALKSALDKINSRADDVKTTWSGLAGLYKAPEQNEVLTAMNVPVTESEKVAGHGSTVKSALNTYATALEGLRTKKSALITDINTFYADKKKIDDDNKDNNILEDAWDGLTGEGTDLLDRENALNGRAAQLLADKEAAERNCANAIGDIWGAERYEAADETWVNDTTTYGMSADGYEDMSKAGDAPWGHPEMWSSGNWFVRGAMIDDGVTESITGTLKFFGNLVGVGGAGKAKAAWSGLYQLADDVSYFNPVQNPARFIQGLMNPEETAARAERLLAVGKGIIGWDNWDTSGWQTGGSVGFDVLLTVGTGGAGGAAKGSIKAAASARFMKFLGATSKLDVKATAAAMKVRLSSSLTTKLDSFATMGQRFNERFGLQPSMAGVPDVPRPRPVVPHHVDPPTVHHPVDPPAPRHAEAPATPHHADPPATHTDPETPNHSPADGHEAPSGTNHPDSDKPTNHPETPDRAADGGPTHDRAGREYKIDDDGRRHIEGDPKGTWRDKNGALHRDDGQFTKDTNPAEALSGDRAIRADHSTYPELDTPTQSAVDQLAHDQRGPIEVRDRAATSVNQMASRFDIDPRDLRSTSAARETLAETRSPAVRAHADSILDAVRTRDTAAAQVRNMSQEIGEKATRSVAQHPGHHTIVDGSGAGAGRADYVTVSGHPPTIHVYEAKGGSGSLGPGRNGHQQGSTAYLNDLLSRDPEIASGLQRYVDANPSSPTAAAIRDGSIDVRYDLVQAKPYTTGTGRVAVRTRVTELLVQRDRIHLPELRPEGTRAP